MTMTKDEKKLNCLEMKEQIQAEMWADYQVNKDKFVTYFDYLDSLDDEFDSFEQEQEKVTVTSV